jgi:hypothetical protein
VMHERIDSIDFWRGVALVTIFINHIPGNILGNLTPRNFGFSDSAEAFVFLSGLSVSLAYANRFESGATLAAAVSLLKRAVKLYQAHVILTVIAILIFGAAVAMTGQYSLLDEHGRGTPFSDPMRGALGILSLSHQIGFFNILPLYIVFIVLAPALFVIGRRDAYRMLAVSIVIYAVTRLSGLNMPSWPNGGFWYFNPFAWQLMFALGLFCGLIGRQRSLATYDLAYWFAHAFTVIAAVIVSDCFGLIPGLVDKAGEYLDWDKTQLGTVRIIDFAALAYVIYYSDITARLRSKFFYPAAAMLGRHALPVYCSGAVMSALGQILRETWTASPVFDVLFVAVGLKGLHTVARFLDGRAAMRFAPA